jgi:23S rRNA (adenine2030-N6)-methyltransferase
MNYRHTFHAGNYADVFKHVLLLKLLRGMQRKEKGFLYLDTHAGRGAFDLAAGAGTPERTPEWPAGIGRLWKEPSALPVLEDYLAVVRDFNKRRGGGGVQPRYYPGSPSIAALVRRPQDRLALWEREDREARKLRDELEWSRSTAVECGDGYGALRAALPPLERRALVLIDPPYEEQTEFEAILTALVEGMLRFPSGVFAIWYPVTERTRVEAFRCALRVRWPAPVLEAELSVTANPQVRMKGCGLAVINPPWGFADEVKALLPELCSRLGVDSGASSRWGWLVPER